MARGIVCTVGERLTATWPFNGVELASECRAQLETQFQKPYKVHTGLFGSNFSYHATVVPFSQCKEGVEFGNEEDAKSCAESLTRISGYSHSVQVIREATFFSAGIYQLMAMCTPKIK